MTVGRHLLVWAVAIVSTMSFGTAGAQSTGAWATAPHGTAAASHPYAPAAPVGSVAPAPVGGSPDAHRAIAQQVLAQAKAAHVPLRDMFLPNFAGGGYLAGNVVRPIGTVAPAPMGLGDFGVRNTSGTAVPYVLQSTSWEGTLTLNSVNSFLVDTGAPDTFTVQLNTVTTNTTVQANTAGAFWLQNVFDYQPSTQTLLFLDNIWNFSSPAFSEPASTFYSYNGTPVAPVFYYDLGPVFTVPMPFTVHLYINTSTTANILANRAWPTVRFGYNILNASGGSIHHGVYDTVLFNATLPRLAVPLHTQMVNGAKLTPTNFLLWDSEIMIGGPGGGTTASIYAISGSEQLAFLNGSTSRYQNDPTAWNIGTDTGETVEGIAESYTRAGTVDLSAGPSIPAPLWNATPGGNLGAAHVQGTISPSNGFIFANGGRSFNATAAGWTPVSPTGAVDFRVPPGNYTFKALMSEHDPWTATVHAVTTTTNSLTVSLVANVSRGVYTPLFAWTNAQLAGISSRGTGTSSDPYVLWNNQNGDLDPLFGEFNDYIYAVFPGIMIANTNAAVSISHPASFHLTFPASYDRRLIRNGLPLTNNLQIEVYNASNVVLRDATGITGWFFGQDYGPAGGLPLANVVFWDVSNSLIAGNTFVSQGSSLVVMNGPRAGGGNVVWGNTFRNGAQKPNFLLNGTPVAIWAFEANDVIYNNYVATTVPAVAPDFSLYNGAPQRNIETWNLSQIEPATVQHVVDGVALSGSVVGSAWQCGNFWRNYFSTTPIPYNDSGLIVEGGDYCPYPLSPATYPVTFTESGLPSGYWAVNLAGQTVSAAAGAPITFGEPVGRWTFSVVSTPPAGYTVTPSSGTVTVGSGSLSVTITFTPPPPPPPPTPYWVNFTESGLAYGSWSVSLGNVTQSAVAGVAISFTGPSAIASTPVPFSVLPVPGYTPSPSSGFVALSPGAHVVTVQFAPPPKPPTLYPVVVTESGLPSGTAWSVTLNGTRQSSFGPSVSFQEPNGSYAYQLGGVPYYTPTVGSGTVVVSGATTSLAVTFTALNGILDGVVNVRTITVTVNGNAVPTSNGNFTASEPPGTYTVVVTAAGYAPYYQTATVTAGQSTHLAISLTAVPSGPAAALSSAQFDGIVAGLVFVGVAILAAALLLRLRSARGGGGGGGAASPPTSAGGAGGSAGSAGTPPPAADAKPPEPARPWDEKSP